MSSTTTYSTSTKNKIETTTTTNSATTTYSASSKIKSETIIITSGTISSAKYEKIRRIRNLPEINTTTMLSEFYFKRYQIFSMLVGT
jgi:hypothetical protein